MTAAAAAPLAGVRRIVFLRPAAVGDFVFALPALQALRRGYPDAEIIYLGWPWHADFVAGRPGPVDRVVVMPPLPGIGLAPDAADPTELRRTLIERLRAPPIDLAIQAYGGGRHSNPFVASLGARRSVGLRAPGAPPLDRCIAHAPLQNRRLQLLELVALAGAPDHRLAPELAVTAADRAAATRVLGRRAAAPLVVIQPGASDARRRWPAVRFAAVADALARQGAAIAVNGTRDEAGLVREVVAAMRHDAVDLAGRLSLGGLCGVLERAALLVSNDTGPLHLALAIGTPAVGIYWFSNLVESQPLRQDRHRAAVSARVTCAVCGAENLARRCPHDASFVDDVAADEVLQLACELLADSSCASGPAWRRRASSRSRRRA